jgi:hypothetical protein
MDFRSDHPDYKSYESNEYFVSNLPEEMSSALQGFIIKQCNNSDASKLKKAINRIAANIPKEPTNNWGWDYLINDLPYYVKSLCNSQFYKIMNFFGEACEYEVFLTDKLNDLLEDQKIGYVFYKDWTNSYCKLRESVTSRTEAIEETTHHVKGVFEQADECLEQAKEHLTKAENDRDLKDAIGNCLSAMESILKNLSGESEIKQATSKLRNDKSWGPAIIVKNGLSLWNQMHNLYPDIRHGTQTKEKSKINREEALYWVERITCFIRYMSRIHKR